MSRRLRTGEINDLLGRVSVLPPQVVFHAAAHNRVPLMGIAPEEAQGPTTAPDLPIHLPLSPLGSEALPQTRTLNFFCQGG